MSYSTSKGFIVKADLLQSTGAPTSKGEQRKEEYKNGIKNCNQPYPNHTMPYTGGVLALQVKVGPVTLYYDVLFDHPQHKEIVDMLSENYITMDENVKRDTDCAIPMWNCWLLTDKEVFVKIKSDVKEGKTYHNIQNLGPTKDSVERRIQPPAGFTPANPFTKASKVVDRPAAAPVHLAAPSTFQEPTGASGLGGTQAEIPF